ncbi:NADH-quinone oxidoreductase subunit J [Risungbinella massiliensis]|uniref:NADH-quinone oxidoreductase subunit J n=1 Tax=Risungbinella massiliensis TaxID=1329796 RepID=UPI0005CBD926|nr:NADH-quinone oxidoreductase subunit J [Risungbinella massiliensis]
MNINGETILFLLLSFGAIGGAIFFINLERVMHMAISLAFCFFSIAGIYLLLHAEFLAVIQILIYTGAVSILMIYGIMLTKQKKEEGQEERRFWDQATAFAGVGILLVALLWILNRFPFIGSPEIGNFKLVDIGMTLFKKYVIPFEIASILLLIALIGAIILAKREEKN